MEDGYIQLTTPRIHLRDHVENDLPEHHRLLSDAEAMRYLRDIQTHSLAESEKNLRESREQIGRPDRRFYYLRMESRETGEHIGEIGYTVTEDTPAGKLVHAGYFSYPHFWGRGYMTEAFREVIRFAFEENGVFRISTGCDRANAASERVMQKCGMQWAGAAGNRVEYRLLRTEWCSERNANERNDSKEIGGHKNDCI